MATEGLTGFSLNLSERVCNVWQGARQPQGVPCGAAQDESHLRYPKFRRKAIIASFTVGHEISTVVCRV